MFFWGLQSKQEALDYDYYEQVFDKFPKDLEKIFLKQPPLVPVSVKPNADLIRARQQYNRVMDESMITQMSASDFQKRNNQMALRAASSAALEHRSATAAGTTLLPNKTAPPAMHQPGELQSEQSVVLPLVGG